MIIIMGHCWFPHSIPEMNTVLNRVNVLKFQTPYFIVFLGFFLFFLFFCFVFSKFCFLCIFFT